MMNVTQISASPGIAGPEEESGGSALRQGRDQAVNSLPATQNIDEDYWSTPDGMSRSETEQNAPTCEKNVSNGEDELDPRCLGMLSPLASTVTAPVNDNRQNAPESWSGMSFGSPPMPVSQQKGYPEDGALGADTADLGVGQPAVDAMGVVISMHGTGRQSSRQPFDYFGPSSTFSLLCEARRLMGRRDCGHGPCTPGKQEPCTACEDSAIAGGDRLPPSSLTRIRHGYDKFHPIVGLSVPPRPEADRLVNLFWTDVHSLYPFLHWPSFHTRYCALWSPQQSPEASSAHGSANGYYSDLSEALFHCMLNVVFALGVLHNTEIGQPERDDISYAFFKRAKSLLNLDLLQSGGVALVQILLLMGQYLQTRDMSSWCWNIIGMAIRVAQGMGLHHSPEGQCGGDKHHRLGQLEEEMRKRAWNGCVLLDR